MFPVLIRVQIQTLLLFILLTVARGQERKISSEINPGCAGCENSTLIYIRAEGSHDTLHQIWDFTRGVPTLIFAVASKNSTITIVWDSDVPRNFNFSEKPTYSFSVAINKLVEYDDIFDNGHIDPRVPQRHYSLRHQTWSRSDSIMTEDEVMIKMRSGQYKDDDKWRSGVIEVKLDLLPFKDYAVDLPHLIHTANSTLLDVSLVNLTTYRPYNASRFALQLLLVSTDPANDTAHYRLRKSLDDEHTPGVFEIMEIRTARGVREDGGFLQFRPVAYTEPARSVASSTNAYLSAFNRTSLYRRSTLGVFFRNFDERYILAQDMCVSFGENGDGFYRHNNYTAWSTTVGYGAPPLEGFSAFVIGIISAGVGVPVALALSGLFYVVLERRRHNRARRLTDETDT